MSEAGKYFLSMFPGSSVFCLSPVEKKVVRRLDINATINFFSVFALYFGEIFHWAPFVAFCHFCWKTTRY